MACGMYRKYTLKRQITASRSTTHPCPCRHTGRLLNDTREMIKRERDRKSYTATGTELWVFKTFFKSRLLGAAGLCSSDGGGVGIFLLNQLQSSRNFQCNLWFRKRCRLRRLAEDVRGWGCVKGSHWMCRKAENYRQSPQHSHTRTATGTPLRRRKWGG